MKRIYCIILSCIIIMSPLGAVCDYANSDNDVFILENKIKVLAALGIVPVETSARECNYIITRREAFRIACQARGGFYYEDDEETMPSELNDEFFEADIPCVGEYLKQLKPFSDVSENDSDYDTMLACYAAGIIKGKQYYYGEKIIADLDSPLINRDMNCIIERICHNSYDMYTYDFSDNSEVTKAEYLEQVYAALYETYLDDKYEGYYRMTRPVDNIIRLKFAMEKYGFHKYD